jgi:hypothetical protein
LALDGAASARWAKRASPARTLDADPMDLEILELMARLGYLLTSQIHRRFNYGRAATTTQRRLKRLSDAGLIRRLQFHRRDGGGVPMCCSLTGEGLRLLKANGRPSGALPSGSEAPSPVARSGAGERLLRQARLDVHLAGWVLALERTVGARCVTRGREESVISPPSRTGADARSVLCAADLRLPGGRTPHDFLRTDSTGETAEVDRFETIRPDAIVAVRRAAAGQSLASGADRGEVALDVIVELDDRVPRAGRSGKLERYDHFLAGWSVHTRRYGRMREAVPLVVFVCRDRPRARDCARAADSVLRACRAYAGEYPVDWQYPGREQIVFVAERDMHERLLHAYGVPRLPPQVRVTAAQGDPGAAAAAAEPREILRLPLVEDQV